MGARRGRKSRTMRRATSRRSRPQKKRRCTMTRIRNLASAALLGASALFAFAPLARAQELPPDQLVKNVTVEVVELITKDREIQQGDRAKLIELIDAKVLPHLQWLCAGDARGAGTGARRAAHLRSRPPSRA